MKIGFIGYGNMAQAIATGLIASKAAAGSRMCACGGNFDKLCRNAEKKGIVPLRTAEEVIENSNEGYGLFSGRNHDPWSERTGKKRFPRNSD